MKIIEFSVLGYLIEKRMKHIVLTEININLKYNFSQNKAVVYDIDCTINTHK